MSERQYLNQRWKLRPFWHYHVSAERSDAPIMRPLCTSTYIRDDDAWMRLDPLKPGRRWRDCGTGLDMGAGRTFLRGRRQVLSDRCPAKFVSSEHVTAMWFA